MPEYVVLGLGRFGWNLATELQALGNEVVAVDRDRLKVQDIADSVRQAAIVDAASEESLRELGVSNFDAAVVAIGDPEPSIMTTLVLKKLGVPYVIAKATSDLHGEILRLVGADRVVFPEKETAIRLAHGIAVPETVDYLSISSDMGISKLTAPSHIVGQTHAEASLEGRFGVRVIAVIRRDKVIFGELTRESYEAGDVLLVLGRDKDLRALSQSSDSRH